MHQNLYENNEITNQNLSETSSSPINQEFTNRMLLCHWQDFSYSLCMHNTTYGQKKQGKIQPSVNCPDFLEAPSPGRS